MALDRRVVVTSTIVGAAAAVLVAKAVIGKYRSKVACGCLFHCTCEDKKKCASAAVPPPAKAVPAEESSVVAEACEADQLEELVATKQPPSSPSMRQPTFEPEAPTAEAGRTRPSAVAAVSPVSFAAAAAALANAAESASPSAAVGTPPLAPEAPQGSVAQVAQEDTSATAGLSSDALTEPVAHGDLKQQMQRANRAAIHAADQRDWARAKARAPPL